MLESWCRQVLIMATRRPRVMFTCSEDIKETLELWSEEEGRTVSNLVERIIAEAIAARAKKLKSSKSKVQDEE
ncbi:MAG: hypothetical protein KME55_39375 [Nostoc indistinguendum CM1-VF10]|nr:hypothetical protein [Nostoc flagelliforme]MBW4458188.1 hypothetical protein [Nostoc indistinguendum CM1-VF10]